MGKGTGRGRVVSGGKLLVPLLGFEPFFLVGDLGFFEASYPFGFPFLVFFPSIFLGV